MVIQITCNIMKVKNSRSNNRPKTEAEKAFALDDTYFKLLHSSIQPSASYLVNFINREF